MKTFYENKLQKTNRKGFRIEKVIKKKVDKLYVPWKSYDSFFNSWIYKKRHNINKWIFSGTKFLGKVEVKLDLSNYAIKSDLKNATGIDTSSFAKKFDLASLKSSVDKLDIDKLKMFQLI